MWGALVLAAVLAGPAYAQSNAATGAQSAVPTVTIINKAPAEAAEEPNALSIVKETEAEGVLPTRARDAASEPQAGDAVRADEASPGGVGGGQRLNQRRAGGHHY